MCAETLTSSTSMQFLFHMQFLFRSVLAGERLHEARERALLRPNHLAKVDLKVQIGRLTPHVVDTLRS